jgi:minichromosome maintenance protein 10
VAHVPRASNILSVLASTNDTISSEPQESVSFHARLPKSIIRDPETLRIIERLELGPYEHKPHKEDPEFKTLEPHSGLRLQYVKQDLVVSALTDPQITLYVV